MGNHSSMKLRPKHNCDLHFRQRMFEACDKNKDAFLSYEESDNCFKGHIAIDHRESGELDY